MVKAAVLLAAGLGSRLGKRTIERPKGFLELDGLAIIEHSITKLKASGIEKIIIGTGYKAEFYEVLTLKYPGLVTVKNDIYENTGSMHTLFLLREELAEDFLLLESDLIYEKRALQVLLDTSVTPDIVLASEFTYSGDEVFIEMTQNQHLKNMSKKQSDLNCTDAELVGITKITLPTYQKMCDYYLRSNDRSLDYERVLVGIASDVEISVVKVQNLAWCEVDDESHWQRALEEVYPIIKVRETVPNAVRRNVLLNPGPATTTDTVKYAQVMADICPREQEFGDVMLYITRELTKFVGSFEEYTTVLFGGSGTAAVEAILSSVVGQKKVVIVNNGAYGKRMIEIAEAYGIDFLEFASPADIALEVNKLKEFLLLHQGEISHLAIVHNETTTGMLNPIQEVGAVCKVQGIEMIVDGMSSYAAIPIDMEKMNIAYLAASSNKNLQGMAGVSFVIARKKMLENTRKLKPRNLYLHLYSQYKHFQMTNQMRFTPPVQTLYALKQAIIETKLEGIRNRYSRYCGIWKVLIEGITRLGLTHLIDEKHHSKIITSINEPTNGRYDFKEMHDYFYERGFTIYPGKFEKMNTFRVANIGDITEKDMIEFIYLLEQYLRRLEDGDS